jgi:hypothetical protein
VRKRKTWHGVLVGSDSDDPRSYDVYVKFLPYPFNSPDLKSTALIPAKHEFVTSKMQNMHARERAVLNLCHFALHLGGLGLVLGPRRLRLLVEPNAHAVDAVPLVRRRRVPLPLEHVAQVAAAARAHDLGALHAEGAVAPAQDGPGHGVEEGRPAAAAAELVRGAVEGRVAPGAGVGALRGEVLVEGARVRRLGALLAEDAELLCVR